MCCLFMVMYIVQTACTDGSHRHKRYDLQFIKRISDDYSFRYSISSAICLKRASSVSLGISS